MNIATFAKRFWGLGLILILLILLAAFPLYTTPLFGSDYPLIFLQAIFMFVILTVSWAFFSGPTGYISLAPAAFFGIGIYTAATVGKSLPLLATVAAAGVASFIIALLVGAVTLRLKGIYFAVFTFGLVVLIKELLLFWEITVTGTRGRFVVLVDNDTIYYIILGILLLTLLTTYFIRRSKIGLAMQSIGENEEAAAHMGVNVTWVKIITFAISAIFMGAVGAIMATKWTYVDPYVAFDIRMSFLPVLMAIFGGVGTFYGPILGSVIFSYMEELLLTKFPYYYMLAFGLILVVVILYLPGGLASQVERLRQRLQKGGWTGKHANT
ncbi:branched-chain amino acid ABC transporter permease [Chloroflexota bacterium]